MNYEEALAKIQTYNRFGSKLGLERMSRLLESLGNPQESLKIIHVAGTNGKGSVCRFITSILQREGYKVGLYTSPFLEKFTERIEFDGRPIDEEDLARFAEIVLEKADSMVEDGWESPTEFEIITAIAFYYYAEQKPDYLILEVGLGGRGDATNVIKNPLVSVITSIAYDHMDYLGNTLEAIAKEKAGIIKKGRPVVVCVTEEGTYKTIKVLADERGSKFVDVNTKNIKQIIPGENQYDFTVEIGNKPIGYSITLRGNHQVQNAYTAIKVIEVLRDEGIRVSEEAIKEGLEGAEHKGRFETVYENPLTIIDGAHNNAGMQSLRNTIEQIFPGKKILLCLGILKDKEIKDMLDTILPIASEIIVTEPSNDRRMSSEEIASKIKEKGVKCKSISNKEEAFRTILSMGQDFDVTIYAGSLYLIGDIRSLYKKI
ncbi:MAG: folylpolyglutamate synthase/dihydrofolate synthase family protein [Peptostreptococcales bacterium]